MIKFRAWEPHYKKMFANDQIIIWNGNVYVNVANKITVDNMRGWSIDDKYRMQSTGLLDKNGDEIFENDIVEWEHKDTGQLVRGIVKYDTEFGFWGMTDVRFNDLRAIGYLANQRVTVLGNIYQNKELVEEENQKLKAANQDLVQKVQELKERRPIIYTADNQGSVVLGRVTAKVQDSHGYTIDVEGYGKFLLDREDWEQVDVGEIATQDILKRGS